MYFVKRFDTGHCLVYVIFLLFDMHRTLTQIGIIHRIHRIYKIVRTDQSSGQPRDYIHRID